MALTPADLTTLSHLLDEALALDPEQREAWLAALPAEHQPHAARLRQMLAAQSAPDTDDRLSTLPKLGADEATARAGERVGAYSLIREIGRGGMGSVWLAARADGSFKREVALKLPRLAWGAGLAERMAREREIGALLEHPHIARMYDAGVDERGRPFLALEYIDGQPIDAWCEAQGQSVRARLGLFLQVARAVAYAHGRLVVHRDLKPSNVLVTADGQAHLLDFGIAKLLHEAVPGELGLTQEQGRVLTPHYASPEQIAGEPITVASDVYSLGVLLYELLTGELPIAPKRGTLGAVEEAILQGDAPLASSRVKDKATARALRGEVDAILAKAMQRDAGRRYATADAMALDIERHLNGETVAARPDSLAYRMRKAVRRHWVGVSAAAAVAFAVLTGGGVAVVQAQRANTEAERAKLVKEFVVEIFSVRGGPEGALSQMPARALLERGAKKIDVKFAGQPLLQAELYGVVRVMFSNLLAFDQAVEYGTRQVETFDAAGAEGPKIAVAVFGLAESLGDLDRWPDAEVRLRRALTLVGDDAGLVVRAHAQLARALARLGQTAAAAQELDRAEAVVARGPDRVPATQLAYTLYVRGQWLLKTAGLDKALPVLDRAIQTASQAEGPSSQTAVDAGVTVARALVWQGRTNEAKRYLEAAIAALRAVGGPNDLRAAFTEASITEHMFEHGGLPFSEAAAVFERCRADVRAQPGTPTWLIGRMDLDFGSLLLRFGDTERGSAMIDDAATRLLAQSRDPSERAGLYSDLAWSAQWTGRVADSLDASRRALELRKTLQSGESLEWAYAYVAEPLLMSRRYAEAEASLAEFDRLPGVKEAMAKPERRDFRRLPIMERALVMLERGHAKSVVAMSDGLQPMATGLEDERPWLLRAAALCATSRTSEGLGLYATWLPKLAARRSSYSPQLAHWRARMGICALDAGARQRAHEASQQASAAVARQARIAAHIKAPVIELERRLRVG
ncbi:MAG: protein kinase [Ideonella sp.]|nr:protein kinase [Ideonella sp.]